MTTGFATIEVAGFPPGKYHVREMLLPEVTSLKVMLEFEQTVVDDAVKAGEGRLHGEATSVMV